MDWIFTGDTLNSFAQYSYNYSGYARGEYPLWNPLVRSGQPSMLFNVFLTANPAINLVAIFSVLSGVEDVILSFSISIFLLVLLYVIGVYLLVSCWLDNKYAGVLAAILALGSSSVFYQFYHNSFLQLLHHIPWILYAVTMYFRTFKFRYLMIFALAFNSALYSYMFVMSLSFFIMLIISFFIFYHSELFNVFRNIKTVPIWHIMVFGVIILLISFPAVIMFLELNHTMVPISRYSYTLTDEYNILLKPPGPKEGSPIEIWNPKFWVVLFTGIISREVSGFEHLRHYVGPMVLPLLVISLLSYLSFTKSNFSNGTLFQISIRKKLYYCIRLLKYEIMIALRNKPMVIAIAGLLSLMLVKNIFPASLVYKLPVFSLIRNGKFFLQYTLFVMVILAGFGFDLLIKKDYKKTFNITCTFLIISLIMLVFFKQELFTNVHNKGTLVICVLSLVLMIFSKNLLSENYFVHSFIGIAAISVISSTLLFERLPMSGQIHHNQLLLNARSRSDHSLKFLFERPDDINEIGVLPAHDSNGYVITDFGKDEFSSFITLADNSYRTKGGVFGLSSFPLLKSYILFTSIPGYQQVMKKKFFFFEKSYTSNDVMDMMKFKQNPRLLQAMLLRNVGLVDQLKHDSKVSVGEFRSTSVNAMPLKTRTRNFQVDIIEYNANSIDMNVSVDKAGVLLYTDSWDKNWRVEVDGENVPIRKVFHTFKGVELSPGNHEVKFKYLSSSLISILAMNIVFAICLFGAVIEFSRKRFR